MAVNRPKIHHALEVCRYAMANPKQHETKECHETMAEGSRIMDGLPGMQGRKILNL